MRESFYAAECSGHNHLMWRYALGLDQPFTCKPGGRKPPTPDISSKIVNFQYILMKKPLTQK